MDRAGDPVLWRCRRGMKELDLLLERFARERYRSASPEHRRAFERLLELPDPLLVDLLLAPASPCDLTRPEGSAGSAGVAGPPAAGSCRGPDGSGDLAVDPDLAEIAALVAAPVRR